MANLQSYTLPVSYAVKRLRESDFALETRDKICLYDDACTLVLFYTESPDSKKILNVFKTVAETVAGPLFAACNVLLEKKIAEGFMEISAIRDHPFNWTATRAFPFILIYRRGYPVNFYDGPADIPILTNFALNIACMPDFHSRNYALTNKIKEEMWTTYYSKNPIALGNGSFGIGGRNTVSLPAIPYDRIKNIE
jgi:hypothetical protein